MSIDQVTAEAMALPPEQRLMLADALYDSVPPEQEEEFDPEYMQEIRRRIEEMESGKVQGIPWKEVQAKIRREFGWD